MSVAPGLFIVFNGELKASPTVLSANGSDSFNFTGIAPSFVGLSKTRADVGASIAAGFNVGLPGSTFSGNTIDGPSFGIRAGLESRPGFPVIGRDGIGPSTVELRRASIGTVSGGLRIPFGGAR
jgi:hypothetical protein